MADDIDIDDTISTEAKPPSPFLVTVFSDNDMDYDWIISVLMSIFNYTESSAIEFAKTLEFTDRMIIGEYPYEIAEQKVSETLLSSKVSGYKVNIKLGKK